MDNLSDKNRNPEIQAKIADIGYLSPHGEALMEIAKAELAFIYEHLKSYSQTAYHIISDTFLGSSKDGVRVFCRMSVWKHLKKTA